MSLGVAARVPLGRLIAEVARGDVAASRFDVGVAKLSVVRVRCALVPGVKVRIVMPVIAGLSGMQVVVMVVPCVRVAVNNGRVFDEVSMSVANIAHTHGGGHRHEQNARHRPVPGTDATTRHSRPRLSTLGDDGIHNCIFFTVLEEISVSRTKERSARRLPGLVYRESSSRKVSKLVFCHRTGLPKRR